LDAHAQAQRRTLSRRLKLTAVALACSLVALIVATIFLAQQAGVVREAMVRQTALTGWLGQFQRLLIVLAEAESSQRGYLLTGRDRYLDGYRQALRELPPVLRNLDTIPIQDPVLRRCVVNIRKQTTLKLAELADSLRLYDTVSHAAALDLVQTDAGQHYMDEVRTDVNTVAAIIRNTRATLNDRVVSGSVATERLAIITVSALVVTLLLAAVEMASLISIRSRYERALARSEQRHRAIVEEQTEFIAIADLDGALQYVNPAYAACFNLAAANIGVGSLYDAVAPVDNRATREAIATALRTDEPVSIESRYLVSGDQPHWIAWRHQVQHTAEGKRIIHSVGRDITVRKRLEQRLEASEQFIRGITDSVPVRLAYFDAQQRFQFANRVLSERLGRPREELIGKTLQELNDIAPGPAAALTGPLQLALRGQAQRLEYADVLGPQTLHIQTYLIPDVAPGGEIRGVFGVGLDVSEQVTSRREVSHQAAALEAIVDAIPAMVGVCDTDLNFQLVNRAYQLWRGKSSKELMGRNLRDVLSPDEFGRSRPWIQRALAGETVSYEIERPLESDARHLSITYIPLRLGDGTVGGFIGMAEDITQHREENLRLLLLAERDPLTGLLNKAGFESYLGKKVAQGEGAALAVLYIDLDHFKPINDTHGHNTGDEVLRQFAMRLHSVVRPTDAVARLGGDEFAVVLLGIRDPESAGTVADKIVELARLPLQVGDMVLHIGASIGVAVNANAEGGWKGLVARADAMSYRAKAEGRGRRALAPPPVSG
jgi:diguanylate cyclase (GGDEF)-like protein/PAS domain S-box-containing protein